MARTPDPGTAIGQAVEAVAAAAGEQDPRVDQLTSPAVLPVTPYGDALELLATQPAEPGPSPTAEVRATTLPAPAEGLAAGPAPAPAAPGDGALAAATGHASALAASALTLDDSARLVAAAQRVLDLSAGVQIALSDALAERAAAEAAAAAAVDAARAAAVEAGKAVDLVEAARTSPNGQIPEQYLCGVNFQQKVLLRCDAAQALEALNRAYRAATGHSLGVTSSYRSAAEQAVLHAEKGDLAAAPGTSNHGWGLAVDLAGAGRLGQFDTPLYLWLTANAPAYGWHHPRYMGPGGSGPLEPWHWEYDTGN